MKKILAAMLTVTLIFSPVGNIVFQDQPTTVEAKSYKSGKKGFSNNNSTNNNSLFQNNKQNSSTNTRSTATTNKSGGFMSSGLMKGLMLGGLAGLLFGGLFSNMGMLGSLLGLAVNVIAIVAVIWIAAKIFSYFTRKNREKEERKAWKS